ncbi:hypothetical protein L6452_20701 [Arctium lappa]|uniref:Uncharacterized protein n=1 Tax=Arctium lappa TaxID=4217 RepID=A0ACB9BC48_ARCLA|nr:hypothetical protein L6452_20701 [Arctium lappa]
MSKISNNYNQKNHPLKPRVYITQSSSFKTLVQELTGYDHTAAAKPTILSAISTPRPEAGSTRDLQINRNNQHADTNDHNCNSMSSFDDLDSSWLAPFDYTDRLSDELQGLQQPPSFVPNTGNQIGVLQDTNLESWLLDIDMLD